MRKGEGAGSISWYEGSPKKNSLGLKVYNDSSSVK